MYRRIRQPHGVALMLVLAAVGMATLIGMAMLSSAALQSQISGSSAKAAAADYMAESAIQTATYYLQRDRARIPATWITTSGYSIRAQNVTISGVAGSFDITAQVTSIPDEYQISVVGRSDGVTPVTRTSTAKIRVQRTTPSYASGFGNSAISIGSKNYFNGGPVLYSGSIVNAGVLNGGSRSFNSSDFGVPPTAVGQVNYYGGNVAGGTYTMPNGNVGTPQILSSGNLTSSASLTALSTNPGKVFYYNGTITLAAAGTYSGTLIARGNVDLKPPNSSAITLNRVAGFPAIVADGVLLVSAKSLNVNLNGVTWLGQGTSWNAGSSTSSNVRINGALLTPAAALPNATGTLTVNYTPANVDVINLTPNVLQPPLSIKFVNWQP